MQTLHKFFIFFLFLTQGVPLRGTIYPFLAIPIINYFIIYFLRPAIPIRGITSPLKPPGCPRQDGNMEWVPRPPFRCFLRELRFLPLRAGWPPPGAYHVDYGPGGPITENELFAVPYPQIILPLRIIPPNPTPLEISDKSKLSTGGFSYALSSPPSGLALRQEGGPLTPPPGTPAPLVSPHAHSAVGDPPPPLYRKGRISTRGGPSPPPALTLYAFVREIPQRGSPSKGSYPLIRYYSQKSLLPISLRSAEF